MIQIYKNNRKYPEFQIFEFLNFQFPYKIQREFLSKFQISNKFQSRSTTFEGVKDPPTLAIRLLYLCCESGVSTVNPASTKPEWLEYFKMVFLEI